MPPIKPKTLIILIGLFEIVFGSITGYALYKIIVPYGSILMVCCGIFVIIFGLTRVNSKQIKEAKIYEET